MRHPNIAQSADFVRNLASREDSLAMREHLASGCERCRRTVGALRRLMQDAEADARESPPEFAKRSAKALFDLERPERRSRLPGVQWLALAGNGLLAAHQGVRGREGPTRQASYESSDYSLDLRLDRPGGAGEGTLSGQLLTSSGEPVAQAAAYLISGGGVTAGCFTSDLGDFQMELADPQAAELWLLVNGAETIKVSLGPKPKGPAG